MCQILCLVLYCIISYKPQSNPNIFTTMILITQIAKLMFREIGLLIKITQLINGRAET